MIQKTLISVGLRINFGDKEIQTVFFVEGHEPECANVNEHKLKPVGNMESINRRTTLHCTLRTSGAASLSSEQVNTLAMPSLKEYYTCTMYSFHT